MTDIESKEQQYEQRDGSRERSSGQSNETINSPAGSQHTCYPQGDEEPGSQCPMPGESEYLCLVSKVETLWCTWMIHRRTSWRATPALQNAANMLCSIAMNYPIKVNFVQMKFPKV